MNSYDLIARFYDYEHQSFRDDIDFYLQLLPPGPVLEVGSGTGRITGQLAEAGCEVWGIEPSLSMVELARQRLRSTKRAHLVVGRLEDLDLDVRFGAALLPLNTLWHFSDLEAQLTALRVIKRHLLPTGLLAVDLSNPLTMADRGAVGEVRRRFHVAVETGSVTGFSAAWDHEADQLIHLELWYDEVSADGVLRRTETELDLRYLFRPELELLLRHSGFRPGPVYGSYDLEAYGSASPRLIALAFAP